MSNEYEKKEVTPKSDIMSWQEFSNQGKTWNDYKKYLADKGALSPNLSFEPTEPSKPKTVKMGESKDAVPWACKNFKTLQDEGLIPQLEDHIHNVLTPDAAKEYLRYLSWCGFPADFVNYHKNNLKKC